MASLTPAPSRVDEDPAAPLVRPGSGHDAQVSAPDPTSERAPLEGRGLAIIAGAMAVAGALGAWGLGRKSLWVDEAISLGATHELVATWKGTGATMALYYALLRAWSIPSADPAWLRSMSVACTVVAVPFAWSAACRAFDRRVAALAVGAMALLPLVSRYAQEARSYALVLLLTSISWCALVASARADDAGDERARRRWWGVFCAASLLAPLAHGLAALQLLGQVAFVAAAPDRRRCLDRFKVVGIGVVAVTAGLVALGASDVASWIPPLSLAQARELVDTLTTPALVPQLVLLAAIALGTWTCIVRARSAATPTERWFALLPIAWGLVPPALLVVASIARPYLLARYVMASAPGLALLLALAVLGTGPAPHRIRSLAVAIPIVAALVVGQVHLHQERGDDWRAAAEVVRADAKGTDVLVLPNPSVRSAFDAAWAEVASADATVPTALSPVEPVGQVRRFYTVHAPDVLASDVAADGAARVWLVDQAGAGFPGALDPFLEYDAIAGRFVVADDQTFSGGVRVVLLERR